MFNQTVKHVVIWIGEIYEHIYEHISEYHDFGTPSFETMFQSHDIQKCVHRFQLFRKWHHDDDILWIFETWEHNFWISWIWKPICWSPFSNMWGMNNMFSKHSQSNNIVSEYHDFGQICFDINFRIFGKWQGLFWHQFPYIRKMAGPFSEHAFPTGKSQL